VLKKKKNNKTEKTFFYCQPYNKKNNEHNGRRCNYYIARGEQTGGGIGGGDLQVEFVYTRLPTRRWRWRRQGLM